MSLNTLLVKASDHLDATAKASGLGPDQLDALSTLRTAADFLYDAAEMIAKGQPYQADAMGSAMALALHTAEGKLAEADEKYGVRALTRSEWRVRRAAPPVSASPQ